MKKTETRKKTNKKKKRDRNKIMTELTLLRTTTATSSLPTLI